MPNEEEDTQLFDVLILGGGVVGLSILRSATLKGWKCILVEREEDLLSHASGSNSGIACTGVDASPGTLERALIRDSISRIREFCKEFNIPNRPCGSLVCRWPWDDTENNGDNNSHTLQDVLLESHDAGDTHAATLQPAEVKVIEPNLSAACRGAVHIPGEIVVDPWLFSICYATHALENGAKIITGWEFDPASSSFDGNIWTARRIHSSSQQQDSRPLCLRARTIVNATGLWSDIIQRKAHDGHNPKGSKSPPESSPSRTPSWKANPRRGQYRLYHTTHNTRITYPIQPIPTQRTKGIFVFGTLYDQIAVGPTAEDQPSRDDRSVDPKVSKELDSLVQRVVPGLNPSTSYVGSYVGIRPGTDQRDYQIHISSNLHWIAAAGIRSTGLTASLGIGRHVAHLLQSLLPEPTPTQAKVQQNTTPLPPVSTLVQDYHQRGDGRVLLNGNLYRVTHPITKFGWDAKTGIANKASDSSVCIQGEQVVKGENPGLVVLKNPNSKL